MEGCPPPLSQSGLDVSAESDQTLYQRAATRQPISRNASAPAAQLPRQTLEGIGARLEKLPGRKVSIKDRIACYQWTWFTMVSTFLLMLGFTLASG